MKTSVCELKIKPTSLIGLLVDNLQTFAIFTPVVNNSSSSSATKRPTRHTTSNIAEFQFRGFWQTVVIS